MSDPAQPGRVVLLGGTSEIGLATLAALGLPVTTEVVLAARDQTAAAAAGARALGAAAKITTIPFEAGDPQSRRQVIVDAFTAPVDLLLSSFGILGDQARAEREPAHGEEILEVDFTAQAGVLLDAAARMRERRSGTLVVFSSVAGVRARKANFVYGSGKAGLDAFARGLADSLHGSGVRVLIVRPGFVVGRMTAGMTPAPFATTPDAVGRSVAAALTAGKADVWVPPALRYVSVAMRLVPRPLWRRVSR